MKGRVDCGPSRSDDPSFDFKVCNVNLRSICNKFPSFRQFVLANGFSAVAVTETWLRPEDPDLSYTIPGYRLLRHDRVGPAGGVALYILESFKCTRVEVTVDTVSSIEYLVVKIVISECVLGLAVIYRPDDLLVTNLNVLSDIIVDFHNNNIDHFLLLGDFNVNLLVEYSSSRFLNELLSQHECIQLVRNPTRVTDKTESLLDLVITNLNADLLTTEVLPLCFSDHNVVVCTVSLKYHEPVRCAKIVRSFKNFNYSDFLRDAASCDWSVVYRLESLEEKVDYFNGCLLELFDNHAPYKLIYVRSDKSFNPWFTSTLRLLRGLVRKAWHRYTRSRSSSDRRYYCSLRNYYNGAVTREKRAYYSASINAYRREPRRLWQQFRRWNIGGGGKGSNTLPDHLLDPDLINDFFVDSIPVSDYYPTDSLPFSPSLSDSIFEFSLPAVEEVESCLYDLKPNVVGADGISGRMLQLALPFVSRPLTHIINVSFETGMVPQQWKLCSVFPIIKNGSRNKAGADLSPADLRPITILPVCLKVAERLFYRQLAEYSSNHNILPPVQSGFRKGHSTATALINVLDYATSAIDVGCVTSLTLLDLSKAFDTVDIPRLITKLKHCGITGHILQWLSSYLVGRAQCTVVGTSIGPESSSPRDIVSGVPQGSVLGPLLFSLYIADIQHFVDHCRLQLYADDIQLYLSFPPQDTSTAEAKINSDLINIHHWATSNRLIVNPSKCQHILLGSKHLLRCVDDLVLNIAGVKIPNLNSVINLGLVLDSQLGFTGNVSHLCKKAYYSWKQLLPYRDVLDSSTKLLLVESLVLSLLNYADVVYGPYITSTDGYRLQKIQNLCMRFVTYIPRFSRVTPYLRRYHCLKINERRFLHYANLVLNIINTECPSYLFDKLNKRSLMHDLNLRHVDSTLAIPSHSTSFFKHGFSYLAAYTYNNFLRKYDHLRPDTVKRLAKNLLLTDGLKDVDIAMY